jgi:hypothetical protein
MTVIAGHTFDVRSEAAEPEALRGSDVSMKRGEYASEILLGLFDTYLTIGRR